MQPVPQSLKIVAWLFFIGSIFAAIDTIFSLLSGRIIINLGVLIIFVGRGLLRLNPRSLSWALFFTWLGLVFTPITALIFLFAPSDLEIFGLSAKQVPLELGLIFCLAAFALFYWQYTVLTNRRIRQLFV